MTCAALIFLWIQNEVSYDRFHPDSDRLYMAWNRGPVDGNIQCWSTTPKILAPTLESEHPEVEAAVSYADWKMDFLFVAGHTRITANSGSITDSRFLNFFNFPLLAGSAGSALNDPFSVVLTEGFARRLFGDENALGKSMVVGYSGTKMNFLVTGVLKALPNNTAFQFDYLLSWELFKQMGEEGDTNWGNNSVSTYVRLKPGALKEKVNHNIKDIVIRHSADERNEVFLYPVSSLKLYSKFVNGQPVGGRIDTVRLMGVLAGFLLLISTINFMNLTTARSEYRAKEIGVRKSLGARKGSLVQQFLGESMLMAFIAGVVSLLMVQLASPFFNALAEKNLVIDYSNLPYWTGALVLIIFVGFLAGSYPAFFLASLRPIGVLKGITFPKSSRISVRRTLVVVQFCFTILLVDAVLVVQKQIAFVQKREIGYIRDHLIYHGMTGDLEKNYSPYKNELIQSGTAVAVSKTFSPITEMWSNTPGIVWAGKDPHVDIIFDRYSADQDFVATAGLQIIAGRDMDLGKYPTDSSAALINESALRIMGFKNPIGEIFRDNEKDWKIVGVVKDFVARSPYIQTPPMVIEGSRLGWFYVAHIRLNDKVPSDLALKRAEVIFRKYNSEYPFEFHFVDDEFDRKFNEERKIERLAMVFGAVAIFISCLGVLGLSMYVAQRRVKEIGIRKVFGASALHVIVLLCNEPVRLIAAAFIITAPVGYWTMEKWLQGYAYRVEANWTILVLAGFLALLLALATISIQTLRSALKNPVDSFEV